MRVLVLGGTGDMGRRAAVDLAGAPDVEELTIASRSVEKGEALAKRLGPKAKAVYVDAANHAQLVEVMRAHDVVAGAVGPYYLFEVPLARAAIEAGVPYVSICDDYDGAQGVLQLDAEAKKRGVTILTGAGWTPGMTNVLVRRGVARLDQAEEAHIAWAASASDSQGIAVLFHMLHILTGRIPSFQNGRTVDLPAGSGTVSIDFGEPMGRVKVYHVGHPEPVTIPHFMPQLKVVTLRGGLLEGYLNTLGKGVAKIGLTSTESRRKLMVKLLNGSMGVLKKVGAMDKPVSGLHVEVRGTKNGRPASVTYTSSGPMADLTALPLAVATLMIGRGQINRPGVLAPEAEGGLDPKVFLNELGKRGVTVREGEIRYQD